MTKSFLSLQTIVMAACLLSFAPAHAQESSKIAFVSTERIFREAARPRLPKPSWKPSSPSATATCKTWPHA
jgi:Skp family chaperone for outer membrane proteins